MLACMATKKKAPPAAAATEPFTHPGGIARLVLCPDGTLITMGASDQTLRGWALNGASTFTIATKFDLSAETDFAVAKRGNEGLLAGTGGKSFVALLALPSGDVKVVKRYPNMGDFASAAMSNSGDGVAILESELAFIADDEVTKKLSKETTGDPDNWTRMVRFSPDGEAFVVRSDENLSVWPVDLKKPKQLKLVRGSFVAWNAQGIYTDTVSRLDEAFAGELVCFDAALTEQRRWPLPPMTQVLQVSASEVTLLGDDALISMPLNGGAVTERRLPAGFSTQTNPGRGEPESPGALRHFRTRLAVVSEQGWAAVAVGDRVHLLT